MSIDIQMKGISNIYPMLLETILEDGAEVAPRGQKTKEIIALRLSIDDMRNNILVHPVRDLNYRFMIAEFCWIMSGRDDLETIRKYNSRYAEFSDDGVTLTGAYGLRLRGTNGQLHEIYYPDQLWWCRELLKKSPDSRQAVATCWLPPCPGPSKDVPCTLTLQFFIRDKRLEMIVTMRSSDAWLGIPYDLYTFSMIGICLAGSLNVEPGGLVMQLGSSHLYERDWEKARALLRNIQQLDQVRTTQAFFLPGSRLLFDLILGDRETKVAYPWSILQQALHTSTKKEALDVLSYHEYHE